ncbi:MAG: hypothetical protein JJE50_11815, partial [Actinomycetales bacterium]|nr:hypothetical protein [Actinomycetales bacterium]
MTGGLVVALVVLAAWLLVVPARSAERHRSGPAERVGWRGGRLFPLRPWRWWREWRPRASPDLGAALVEVAARLRAGADVETAWERSLPGTQQQPHVRRRPYASPPPHLR